MESLPYWWYTDTSDEALGCALQQIQPISIKDLKGTRLHGQLKKAYDTGKQPPNLVVQLPLSLKDGLVAKSWVEEFQDTVVYIEWVIAYWSHTFKSAETRYSTTECKALAAKEGLVKFQPFIEGEKVMLITNHAALQWAKTYENLNHRLAAWGTVFSAYAPHLSIVHQPGRKHSNVDPLSRLYQALPPQDSPARDDSIALEMNPIHIDFSSNPSMGKAALVTFSIHNRLEEVKEVFINTRSSSQRDSSPIDDTNEENEQPVNSDGIHRVDSSDTYWGATNPPPNVLVHMEEDVMQKWIEAYQSDPHLVKIWKDPKLLVENWTPRH